MAIVWLLRSRQKMSAAQLAEAFGVGERTIYRDVQALSEAGVPVAALPGPGGGYALAEGYRLSPIAFGTDEVEALWIAGRLVSGMGLAGADGALQSALAKILAVAGEERADHVTLLDRHLDVQLERRGSSEVRPDVFATLRQAVLERKTVHLTHLSSGDSPTRRDVTPDRLLFQRGAWYVQGADSASGEVRTFRLDRIQSCELTDKPAVVAEAPPEAPPVQVVLRLDDRSARWYAEHPVFREWCPRHEPPGHLTLDVPVAGLNSLIATVLSGGGEEVVVEPPRLARRIAAIARGASAAHRYADESDGAGTAVGPEPALQPPLREQSFEGALKP